jgi:hypothetical protein
VPREVHTTRWSYGNDLKRNGEEERWVEINKRLCRRDLKVKIREIKKMNLLEF